MSRDCTTDPYGNIAVPNLHAGFVAGFADKLPVILGGGTVRRYAREIADQIVHDVRSVYGPIVWITSNAYMPPMRDIPLAEEVWNAENNADGELWEFLMETVEDHLSRENIVLESPEFDNSVYAVDLRRWQYREFSHENYDAATDLNDEWEPVDPHAVDDNAENPRE